jgi:TilS substrate binding domain
MTQPTSPSADTRAVEGDPEPDPRPRRRGLRRLLERLTADPTELHAEELEQRIAAAGAQPIARCGDREKVRVAGTLRTVTIRPRAGVPSLEADLWDGTGDVFVVWLGRREIPGITPGRHIRVEGRITTLGGHRAIYNPIYELLPSPAD